MAMKISATIVVFVLIPAHILIASTLSAEACSELPGFKCYDFANGTHYGCSPGRCCSIYHYCGNTTDYCSATNCAFQCNDTVASPPTAAAMLSINNVTNTVVKVTRNEYYDHDQIASLSCVDSLKNLSSESLHKYAWTSLRVNNAATSTCGQCLKVTNIKTGVEAMVRVVHEPTTTATDQLGLELGTATFNELHINNDRDHEDLVVVKYNFESCD